MLIDLSCPVENRGISVRTNSQTGENYLLLKLLNISEKTITSLNINIKAFDENGNEIASLPVELTELCAVSKDFFAENKAISIAEIPDARNFIVEVTQAIFEDGEIYKPSEENTISYDDSEAPLQDALLIRELVPDAVCFSSEHENYWRCTCGRPNFKDAQNCVRCGREKGAVLTSFSSKTALNNAISAAEEERKQQEEKEAAERIAKKKKKVKNIITAGIVLVALIVLFVIAYFARIGIINILAGNAAKSGDYLKAYELYSKINSSKVSKVTDKVAGNTSSNLTYGTGFLAEDEENLYYITRDAYSQPVNLIKENKKTGETKILTDAAYSCLNVVGDYVYFINNENYPCRMQKDGKTIETLLKTQVYYIYVVGQDMYYIKTDYDNPKGLTDEECEILASQGQLETFTRIYKLNLNTKKDTLVSKESVYMFSIYGDRIFYLTPTETDDIWAMANLKSMNLKGKDIKTVVDSPVNSFFVKDDVLYYISCFDESLKDTEITDISSYDYSIISLDLNNGEKNVISSDTDIIMDMNILGDSIAMISYNRDEFFGYYTTQPEDDAVVPTTELKIYDIKSKKTTSVANEDLVSMNICNDEIFAILADSSLARLDDGEFKIIDENGKIAESIIDTDLETEE